MAPATSLTKHAARNLAAAAEGLCFARNAPLDSSRRLVDARRRVKTRNDSTSDIQSSSASLSLTGLVISETLKQAP